jgi:hypothetical protein
MTTLSEACADLRPLLPVARALLAEPDAQGSACHPQPGSAPPWNQAAANALYDAHAAIRDTEQEFRQAVTGRPAHLARRPGWSDGNTEAALDAIGDLGEAVSDALAADAARVLGAAADAVLMLPAVDLEERPQRIRASCPYCGRPMLRVLPRSGQVTCLAFGACADSDGCHPRGLIGRSRLDGSPVIEWADGLVT